MDPENRVGQQSLLDLSVAMVLDISHVQQCSLGLGTSIGGDLMTLKEMGLQEVYRCCAQPVVVAASKTHSVGEVPSSMLI